MTTQQEAPSSEATTHRIKEVFVIIDTGADRKPIFRRVGTAFVNRDGSLNVKLDALPINGTLHIRDPRPQEQDDASERA